jgi:hypothetical protein
MSDLLGIDDREKNDIAENDSIHMNVLVAESERLALTNH